MGLCASAEWWVEHAPLPPQPMVQAHTFWWELEAVGSLLRGQLILLISTNEQNITGFANSLT